jgi:hypothetical protein
MSVTVHLMWGWRADQLVTTETTKRTEPFYCSKTGNRLKDKETIVSVTRFLGEEIRTWGENGDSIQRIINARKFHPSAYCAYSGRNLSDAVVGVQVEIIYGSGVSSVATPIPNKATVSVANEFAKTVGITVPPSLLIVTEVDDD